MTAATDLHPLAKGYLDRLRVAARALTDDEANDLVTDISDHLREAIADQADEAAVRDVLDRLGTPQELVAAAGGPSAPLGAATVPARERGLGAVEILALVGLVGAELLFWFPPVALLWLAGLVLVAVSRVWSGRQKSAALAILGTGFPVAVGVLLVAAPTGVTSCSVESVATEVGPDAVVSSTVPPTCVTDGGWPDWAFTVVQVLFVVYLCAQVWTLWRVTRRR